MTLLAQAQVPFTVVVEPQDMATYQAAGWSCAVLPADDQGLPFARRHILTLAGASWLWMLDDDITALYRTVRGKCVPCPPADALATSQEYFASSPSIAQAALEYQQFAWRAKQPYVRNGYCDVCVAIHTGRTRLLTYRNDCALKEDRDFTLQVLAAGYATLRVTAYSFACPKNGSNAGGLAPLYATRGREALASQRMAALWPGICKTVTKPDGRQDVAINWGYFRR
jgi:hypothetical protein